MYYLEHQVEQDIWMGGLPMEAYQITHSAIDLVALTSETQGHLFLNWLVLTLSGAVVEGSLFI